MGEHPGMHPGMQDPSGGGMMGRMHDSFSHGPASGANAGRGMDAPYTSVTRMINPAPAVRGPDPSNSSAGGQRSTLEKTGAHLSTWNLVL